MSLMTVTADSGLPGSKEAYNPTGNNTLATNISPGCHPVDLVQREFLHKSIVPILATEKHYFCVMVHSSFFEHFIHFPCMFTKSSD